MALNGIRIGDRKCLQSGQQTGANARFMAWAQIVEDTEDTA